MPWPPVRLCKTGCVPFEDEDISTLYKKIVNGDFMIPESLSSDLQDLLSRMISVDPRLRIDMEGIK